MNSLKEGWPLVVIIGPTACGKSALAVRVAEEFDGEIVNCDSVQIYRGLNVGSGQLSLEERRGIPHHLLDMVAPEQLFTAGDYRREATQRLEEIRQRERLPIVVGGTGLYLRALLEGLFEAPGRSPELRARLKAMAERRGREFVHRLLRRLDPVAAARIGCRDLSKAVRAIEISILLRQPMSRLQAAGRKGLRGFHPIKVGFNPDRAQLYERINRRTETMFAQGLLDETRQMLSHPEASDLKPISALGYRQAIEALRGRITVSEALRAAQQATRNYAKRQITWFRREPRVEWFEGFADDAVAQKEVLKLLRRILGKEGKVAQPPVEALWGGGQPANLA